MWNLIRNRDEPKMEYLYHGSFLPNINILQPFSKSHNTIKKAVTYLTQNNVYALFYIWNKPYK